MERIKLKKNHSGQFQKFLFLLIRKVCILVIKNITCDNKNTHLKFLVLAANQRKNLRFSSKIK